MNVNLSNYIESVLNPNGRFKTLEGIYAVRNDDGEPAMSINEHTVDFEMVYKGEYYKLRCFLEQNEEHVTMLREISLYTKHISCPHLTSHAYLDEEMLVFDNFDNASYVDIILHKRPDGVRFDKFLREAADRNDVKALRTAIEGIAELGEWLISNDFAHNDISTKNIYMTSGSTPVLVNYAKSGRKSSPNDLRALGAMAAAIYVAACQPELYAHITHDKALSMKGLNKLSHLIADIMSDEDAAELKGLLSMISESEIKSDSNVCAGIRALTKSTPRSYRALENIAAHLRIENAKNENAEPVKYSFIGEMRDMVMRVFDGESWFYIDRMGNTAFKGRFTGASDFAEGRAVVETDEGYGLIDLNGEYVIGPGCDDIEWDNKNNIAVVTVEGMSGLYSREGDPITGLIYDQILDTGEVLIPVKKDGRFGYIRRDGKVVIEPVYDDAFSFSNGCARVSLGHREFLIDAEGRPIE